MASAIFGQFSTAHAHKRPQCYFQSNVYPKFEISMDCFLFHYALRQDLCVLQATSYFPCDSTRL